jgi:hypothetical protein
MMQVTTANNTKVLLLAAMLGSSTWQLLPHSLQQLPQQEMVPIQDLLQSEDHLVLLVRLAASMDAQSAAKL